jgi:ribosomal silencing factor RsfS
MVVDAGSVVAHIFQQGYREEYALEELWGGARGQHITRIDPKPTLHTLDTLDTLE